MQTKAEKNKKTKILTLLVLRLELQTTAWLGPAAAKSSALGTLEAQNADDDDEFEAIFLLKKLKIHGNMYESNENFNFG